MPLRDDHDAALARADALQVELDRERNEHAQQGSRIESLERELREARSRLERAEETLGDLKPKRPVDADNPRVVASRAPHSDDSARAGLLLGGGLAMVAIVIGLGYCATRSGGGERSASQVEPVPTGPFLPDRLIREGAQRISADLRWSKLDVDYVQPDGMLDPTHGRIVVETRKPSPPKPADDPNRPTGAPEPNDRMMDMMLANCPTQSWNPRSGWAEQQGSCLGFSDEPVGELRCTVAAILERARADGAPSGLARVSVEWSYFLESGMRRGWKWTFSITDSAREISFRRDYDDSTCLAVER